MTAQLERRLGALEALLGASPRQPTPGGGFLLVRELDADGLEVNADRITGFLIAVDDAAEPAASK